MTTNASGPSVDEMDLVVPDKDKPHPTQNWERSPDDVSGYFTLRNPETGKFLTGESNSTPNYLAIEDLDKVTLSDVIVRDGQYDDELVPTLINKWISCSLDTGNDELNKLVQEVNSHKHTKSCQKGNLACRFHFPRFPSKNTIIAKPISEEDLGKEEYEKQIKKSKDILILVKKELESDGFDDKFGNDLDKLLAKLNITLDEYESALKISQKGSTVVLKRNLNERMVNNFNPHYLLTWQANMDIQFVMDTYAVITYITDYMTKSDAGLTAELKKALNETKGCNDFEQLTYLKKVYFTHKQVGVSEATYRLLNGLSLTKSSLSNIFVATGFPQNRSAFYRSVSNEQQSEPEPGEEQQESHFEDTSDDLVTIPGRQGHFKKVNTIHQKYSERPDTLEKICLAQFATSYHYVKSVPQKIDWGYKKDNSNQNDDGDINASMITGEIRLFATNEKLPRYIRLKSGGFMALKTRPIILRLHSSTKKERHEGLYSELLLYFPWRNEKELGGDDENGCYTLFSDNSELIESNKKSIFPNSKMIDMVQELLESCENTRPTHISDTIDANAQQEDMDDQEDLDVNDPLDTSELPDENDKKGKSNLDGCPYKPIPRAEKDELIQMARNLSFEQRVAFDKQITYCKSILRAEKRGQASTMDPPLLIVHGGGGTGKSYLIMAVSQWIEKILRKATDNPENPKVLLLAYTGVAASLIGGTTFHTGLGFKFGSDLYPLTDKKLDMTRKYLEDVEFVIVDEMSMVSSDNLYNLHKRLQQIFVSEDFFGGRSVMLVGDILQLPPVKAPAIYSSPRNLKSYSLYKTLEQNLWLNCESVLLETNFRQGTSPWLELLNRVRIGEPTAEDIETLKNRPSSLLSPEEYKKATHIFYTNVEVNLHNITMLNELVGHLFEIHANCTGPKGYKAKPDKNGLVDGTQFVMKLQLKIGARVMINTNVSIKDSLVNGALGTVIDILVTDAGDIKAIIVAMDDPEAGEQQRKNYPADSHRYEHQNGCPLYRKNVEYSIPSRKSNKNHGCSCKVSQFPLRLAWASTSHKVQGVTFKKGTNSVCHDHPNLPGGNMYTQLSRSQAKENVFMDGFTGKIRANPESLKENAKLVERSIVPSYHEKHFAIFMVNIGKTLKNKVVDLELDGSFAQKADHICVVETWIDPDTSLDINMPGRTFDHASYGPGKGCGIFSLAEKSVSKQPSVITEKYQLMSMVDESIPGHPYQLILVYASQGCPWKELTNNVSLLLKQKMPVIITGDFNFDRTEKNYLASTLASQGFEQIVNWPTQDTAGRTLDQCFVSRNTRVQLTRYSPYYTDHSALCIEFEHFPFE